MKTKIVKGVKWTMKSESYNVELWECEHPRFGRMAHTRPVPMISRVKRFFGIAA